MTVDGAHVVVYQPQAVSWLHHDYLATREAVAITLPGERSPLLGTAEISFSTWTDAASGNVVLSDPQLHSAQFPSLEGEEATRIEQWIRTALPDIHAPPVALQTVILSLEDLAPAQNVEIDNDPPIMFYSSRPASLVVIDGEPVLAPVGSTGLSAVVNTNWDLFTDGVGWYLLDHGSWLMAPAYTGPYRPVFRLPQAFASIPADANFAAVRNAIPPLPMRFGVAPQVFVSTKPADMIITNGPAQLVPVKATALQSVRNTNSVVFFEPSSGRFFLLESGRWFAADSLDGPWRFASAELPEDFAHIRPDGPLARVLPSVPGTMAAQLALQQAEVPRLATLKTEAARLHVSYAGSPQFEPIADTPMRYAVNTAEQVIETDGKFYVCYQGVWFEGASADGPWSLAADVPSVIYTIPPSHPMHNVTYVRVYGATPWTVTFGYTSGYLMSFVAGGVPMHGTGYYYPPVVLPGPTPAYYPFPYTYVGNIGYNAVDGTWSEGGAVYGPYGGVAKAGATYNPATGIYGTAGVVYGPNGGAGAFSRYNPKTGLYAHGSALWARGGASDFYNPRIGVTDAIDRNADPYARWGVGTVLPSDQTEGGGGLGGKRSRDGGVRAPGGDVYAGFDGLAYRHTRAGWSQWKDGLWQPLDPPSASGGFGGSRDIGQPAVGGTEQTAVRASGRAQRARRPAMEFTLWQQVEQDRHARSAVANRFAGFAGGWRFAGGKFEVEFEGGLFAPDGPRRR